MAEGVSTLATTGTAEVHAEPSVIGVTAAGFVALSMLVVVAIMLWQRVPRLIARMLDARIAAIRGELGEASRLRAEAEAMLTAAQQRTASSRGDAAAIVSNAEAEGRALLAKAQTDADDLVRRRAAMAEDKIGAAELSALVEVRARAADAATRAAGAIIAERHGAEADRALIDRGIVGLGRAH